MIGLALSGGGYRASLFHLGVMARLADEGLLKDVQALSTVSGGSIVGAFYYQMLCEELRRDEPLTNQDYRNLMQRVIGAFVPIVQENLRDRVVTAGVIARTIPKPILQPAFKLISKLLPKGANLEAALASMLEFGMGSLIFGSTVMRDLMAPPVHPSNAKPELILNTSILENGQPLFVSTNQASVLWAHNERNHSIRADEGAGLPLAKSVAASACVPGLFDPIAIPFDDRTVHGVDGGVLDNLGGHAIELIRQNGMQLLISDASKPLSMANYPEVGSVESFLRIQDLFMNAIRDLRLEGKDEIVVGMRSEIPGIDQTVRTLAMTMRTDLNAFSEVEAYTLMYVGYYSCGQEAGKLKGQASIGWESPETTAGDPWPFMVIRDYAESPTEDYLAMLGQKEEKRFSLPKLSMARLRRWGYFLFYIAVLVYISIRHGFYDAFWYVLFSVMAITIGGVLLLQRRIAKGKRRGTIAALQKKSRAAGTTVTAEAAAPRIGR